MTDRPTDEEIRASGPQHLPKDEDPYKLVNVGVGTLGIGALGFVPTKDGRLWDHGINIIRAVESGSPGGVLKTFRISESLSIFESWDNLNVGNDVFNAKGSDYSGYLKHVFGSDGNNISMKRTGSIFGDVIVDGKVVGVGVNVAAGGPKGAGIGDYYARVAGFEMGATDSLSDDILKSQYKTLETPLSFKEWKKNLTPAQKRQRILLGAKFRSEINFLNQKIKLTEKQQRLFAKGEVLSKFMRAKAATTVGRLNTLLTKPFEVPVVGDILDKMPLVRHAAIKPGTASQMFKRYTVKGLQIGAAAKALSYYDYLRANDEAGALPVGMALGAFTGGYLMRGPKSGRSGKGALIGAAVGAWTALDSRFDDGIFHGFMKMGTDANVARAKASEAIGLSASLASQERITPGLIDPYTAIAFTGVGTLAAGVGGYGHFLAKSAYRKTKDGGLMGDIFDKTRNEMGENIWDGRAGKIARKIPGGKYLTKVKNRAALGALAGLGAWTLASSGAALASGNYLAAIPGLNLLGSGESSEELEAIYSGEKEIAVRKGRWWEFGRSSKYEGGKIDYYRPHALHRLKTRSYQKGLWGTEKEKWDHDPILHPFKALFGDDDWKYYYDEKYKYERPAPLSSTYGDEIPFIGPLVAATIGKVLKPRKKMREEEWNLGGGEYAHTPGTRGETEPSYELGGLKPGAPVGPDDMSQVMNELNYRKREAVGLPGFVEGALMDAITGREEVSPNLQTIATMGNETSATSWLWNHIDIGGGAGTSEVVRRFLPRKRSYLDEYNPLTNNLPSWLPDDYFIDLKHGNPFDKIKEAEIRLPGTGYAALNPEVEGLNPEDYPLLHRLKILSDVAMWSDEYKETMKEAQGTFTSETDIARINTIRDQVRSRKIKKEFSEYRFDEDQLRSEEVTIKKILSPKRFLTEEYGDMIVEMQGMGRIEDREAATSWAYRNLINKKVNMVTSSTESRSVDYIKAGGRMKATFMLDEGEDLGKFMSDQGWADEAELKDEYEQLRFTDREREVGKFSENLLHSIDSPLEMVTPFSPASKFIRQRTAIEEYAKTEAIGTGNAFWNKPIDNFLKPAMDMMSYNRGNTDIPEHIQQKRAIEEYFDMLAWKKAMVNQDEEAAAETIFGADAFSAPQNIMAALPRRDRDYFKSFMNVRTDEDKQEILNLTPSNQDRLYTSMWLKEENKMARGKKMAGLAGDYENKILSIAQAAWKSEGFEINEDLEEQWYNETNGDLPYDDWIRKKKAEKYFSQHSLPGADWLGWHPSVDMEDVKLKYIESSGMDHHDFDLWGQRKRALIRKPYIDEELIGELEGAENLTEDRQVYLDSSKMMKSYDQGPLLNVMKMSGTSENSFNIEIADSRDELVNEAYKYMGAR